eukprot:474203_1
MHSYFIGRDTNKNSNFFYDLQSREYVPSFRNNNYRNNREYPSHYVGTISPLAELIGHSGCVNRLDWNESGNLLASGSDDTTVKIWKPFEYYYTKNKNDINKSVCNIQTDHIHNLFGVRFIPGTNDRYLCTGSMDKLVQIQSVDRQRTIKNYQIHTDRVKDVQITPKQPFIFYSVSEDGTIRRFDIRMEYKQFNKSPNRINNTNNDKKNIKTLFRKAKKHINNHIHNNNNNNNNHNGNILIKLDSSNICNGHKNNNEDIFGLNDYMERCMLKGLSINPIRDYEFAIASGDEYVRIFDIRKGNKLTWKQCMSWVVPPHFKYINHSNGVNNNSNNSNNNTHIHTTFVEYSSDGSQIVVTYHGENVYVFNTKNYDTSYPLHSYINNNNNNNNNNNHNGNILIKLDSSNICNGHKNNNEDIFGLNDYMERCMLKGLSINPIRDYEFAIASGDEYVRIFDIRKGNKLTWKQCMSWVVPPHFKYINHSNGVNNNSNNSNNNTHIHTTFVEYSSDGSQIVVTYHGENVYVFNTKNYDTSYPLHSYINNNNNNN